MDQQRRFSEALDYHEHPRPGKTEVRPTKATATQADLSLAYTPGVAEPCLEIADDPEAAFRFTNRGNLVAVVTNGSAVLGLGDIGALAGKPVMEGKGVLFKRFADIDVFDLELNTTDPADIIKFCELLEPTVGGINLEDIKAPDCFIIEQTLREKLNIPVFHDDQHGTAIIGAAGFLNALELTNRNIGDISVVFIGAGAAGIATARFFRGLGVRPEHILMCDSRGVLHADRTDLSPTKSEFARSTDKRTLEDALHGADCFVGVSSAGIVTVPMVESMAERPIVFALANPVPEIDYDVVRQVRPDAIVATGRSDYPNQVNNVLGFPFIFRGALDVLATGISEGMKVAAARALADLAKEPVPEGVLKAYGREHLAFGPEYIIPTPFDPRVLWNVASAVAEAATNEGLARRPLADVAAYRHELQARFQASHSLISTVRSKAQDQPMRVVYPNAEDTRILRAARRVRDEGIGRPVILGNADRLDALSAETRISLEGIDVIDPLQEIDTLERFTAALVALRAHKDLAEVDAAELVKDHNYFAAMMVHEGTADAVLGGLSRTYPETIRPALQILRVKSGRSIVSAHYVVIVDGTTFFFTDCAVNIQPTADQLAEIAEAAVESAERMFDHTPRVAFISYSDFGSATGEEPERVRDAIDLFRERRPDVPADGEMHADTAVVEELISGRRPGSPLDGAANVLVFPNLTAANASYKLLNRLADAEVIGPILSGLSKSVHVLQRDADVGDVVNLTAIAVADAQRKR